MPDNTIAVSGVVTGPGVDVAATTFHNVTNLDIDFASQVLSFDYNGPMGSKQVQLSMASISAFSVSITLGVWAVTLS